MSNYHNLSDAEREQFNLPPAGFQGNEFTVILQGPTMAALKRNIEGFRTFARDNHYDHFQVLEQGKDPDSGFRAIVVAHNFNPITWMSEKFHRAKLGAEHGWEQGAKKAKVRHDISQQAELELTRQSEIARQRIRGARLAAAAPIREETEADVAAAQEEARRKRLLEGVGKPSGLTSEIFS